jgi:hypothetical protein
MARKVVPLSALQVERAKPIDKQQTLFDGGGLFLLIQPKKVNDNGKTLPASKLWRLKYRYQGKSCMISLGIYPDVTLEMARERRQEARRMLATGVNPSEERKHRNAAQIREQEIQQNTFEHVARQWYDIAKTDWVYGHARTVLSRMERDIFPPLGQKLISEISTKDYLQPFVLLRRDRLMSLHTESRPSSGRYSPLHLSLKFLE